jgi:flagellar motor switch protein FliG
MAQRPRRRAAPTPVGALARRVQSELPMPSTATDDDLLLNGSQKALLFLVSIDEDVATRVIAHLEPKELERLRGASASMHSVPDAAVTRVQREFLAQVKNGVATSLAGSERYLQRLVRNALGDNKASEIFLPAPKTPEDQLPAYKRLPPPVLAAVLETEHPQTTALVLSQLSAERAAETLNLMPEAVRAEVVLRIGHLEEVPQQILAELDVEFRSHLERMESDQQTKVDGKEAATGILKRLAQEQSQALLEELAATDATMADKLQQALFTFADLNRMDARGMQQLLKEVPTDQLVLALKSASEELKNKVLSNLSSRAADMLREDLALLGPTRIADVEAAQRSIVETALQLERDGRVTIVRDGGGDYV